MQTVVAPVRQSHETSSDAERRIEQIDTTVDIVTPENIAFHYQLAGPFRRLGAYGIDVTVIIATLVLLVILWTAVISPLLFWLLGALGGLRSFVSSQLLFTAFFLVSWFVLYWFYGGLFEAFMNGQTPGKWALGIRVLTTDGRPINGLQAILRNILRLADCFPLLSPAIFAGTFVGEILELLLGEGSGGRLSVESLGPWTILPTYGVGLLTAVMNRRFQRVGDLVCGTMVVLEERRWLMGLSRLEDRRTSQLAARIPPKFQVGRSLAHALATYVERRRYFPVARRREIAQHLGEPLLRQFGMPPDTSWDLLLCALYYRTFIADRGEPQEGAVAPYAPPVQAGGDGITFLPAPAEPSRRARAWDVPESPTR